MAADDHPGTLGPCVECFVGSHDGCRHRESLMGCTCFPTHLWQRAIVALQRGDVPLLETEDA